MQLKRSNPSRLPQYHTVLHYYRYTVIGSVNISSSHALIQEEPVCDDKPFIETQVSAVIGHPDAHWGASGGSHA